MISPSGHNKLVMHVTDNNLLSIYECDGSKSKSLFSTLIFHRRYSDAILHHSTNLIVVAYYCIILIKKL